MIDILFVLGVIALITAAVVERPARRRKIERERYAKCLANINVLERQLLPHLFPKPLPQPNGFYAATMAYDMRPGARWEVDSVNDIQIASNPYGSHAKKRHS